MTTAFHERRRSNPGRRTNPRTDGTKHQWKHGCGDPKSNRAVTRAPKQFEVDFQPCEKHQQELSQLRQEIAIGRTVPKMSRTYGPTTAGLAYFPRTNGRQPARLGELGTGDNSGRSDRDVRHPVARGVCGLRFDLFTGFSPTGVALLLAQIIGYIMLVLFGLSRVGAYVLKNVENEEDAYFVVMLSIMTIAGVLAAAIQLPDIVGAFLAGLASR